jgi:hypothetical protein
LNKGPIISVYIKKRTLLKNYYFKVPPLTDTGVFDRDEKMGF